MRTVTPEDLARDLKADLQFACANGPAGFVSAIRLALAYRAEVVDLKDSLKQVGDVLERTRKERGNAEAMLQRWLEWASPVECLGPGIYGPVKVLSDDTRRLLGEK